MGRKRFHPCCGYFLRGAVKWISILNIVRHPCKVQMSTGLFLMFVDIWQIWDQWILEKRENFSVKLWVSIAYTIHILVSYPIDLYLAKVIRPCSIKTDGLLYWIVLTFINTVWVGVVYHLNVVYFGLHVIYNVFWGYFLYRFYTLIVVYYYMKEIKENEKFQKRIELTDEEIQEFRDGLCISKVQEQISYKSEIKNHYVSNNRVLEPKEAHYSRYNKEKFEISLAELFIDENKKLGSGAFGRVYRGRLLKDGESAVVVAVKTINPEGPDITYFKALLSELKVMSYLGNNKNIVTLIGALTTEIKQKKLTIVTEYCAYGSLYDYLRASCKRFSLDEDYIKNLTLDNNNGIEEISNCDILNWSYQIATGMAFLESKKVIHSDLATRNVLLTSERNIKITDFGLSKQLHQYSVYIKNQNTPLPWRWLALESLTDMIFSSKSDVWSYGVTVWEIFSLAEKPWPQEKFTLEFTQKLKNGMRLLIPINCSDEIYSVLLHCWNNEPNCRPSFNCLKQFFFDQLTFNNYVTYT